MRGKRLAQRRQQDRELAKSDAARRCAFCKQALTKVTVIIGQGVWQYCSEYCEKDHAEAIAELAAMQRANRPTR